MSRKPPPFLTFSISHQRYTTNFTLDYHNSRHEYIQLYEYLYFDILTIIRVIIQSYQKCVMYNYIPEDITHDEDQLSTKPIQQKRLEITKMMVSEDIPHDDDQLSTKTIRRKRLKIMNMMVLWKQKKILRKKRVYSKTSCVIFHILIVGVLY